MAHYILTRWHRFLPIRRAVETVTAAHRAGPQTLIREWHDRRQMAMALGRMSSAALRDIGLTGDDVEAARIAPLGQPAALALAQQAQDRAAHW